MQLPFVVALVACANAALMQESELNLDLDPYQRWQAIASNYSNAIADSVVQWNNALSGKIPNEKLMKWPSNMPDEYKQEILGIVDAVNHPNVTWESMLTFNMMYEILDVDLGAGILAEGPDGNLHHGRIMPNPDGIELKAIDLKFMRGGVELYRSVQTLGLVGVHTGMRSGADAWSVSLSSRMKDGEGNERVRNNRHAAFNDHASVSMIKVREALEEAASFHAAVNSLSAAKFQAPCYVTVAGSNKHEGTVISGDRMVISWPFSNKQDISGKHWFFSQALHKHSRSELDQRLTSLGQKWVDSLAVMELLYDTQASQSSSFGAIMNPKAGFYMTLANTGLQPNPKPDKTLDTLIGETVPSPVLRTDSSDLLLPGESASAPLASDPVSQPLYQDTQGAPLSNQPLYTQPLYQDNQGAPLSNQPLYTGNGRTMLRSEAADEERPQDEADEDVVEEDDVSAEDVIAAEENDEE